MLEIIAIVMPRAIARKIKRKETYRQRWLKEHPPILIYLSHEDYELLKKLSNDTGLSYRELLIKALSDIKRLNDILYSVMNSQVRKQAYEQGYNKGYNKGYDQALKDIYNAKISEKTLRKYGMKYIHCTVCGKPFQGYVIKTSGTIADAITKYATHTTTKRIMRNSIGYQNENQHIYKDNHHSYHNKVIKHD